MNHFRGAGPRDRGPGGRACVLAWVQPRSRTSHRRVLGAGLGRSVRLHRHHVLRDMVRSQGNM